MSTDIRHQSHCPLHRSYWPQRQLGDRRWWDLLPFPERSLIVQNSKSVASQPQQLKAPTVPQPAPKSHWLQSRCSGVASRLRELKVQLADSSLTSAKPRDKALPRDNNYISHVCLLKAQKADSFWNTASAAELAIYLPRNFKEKKTSINSITQITTQLGAGGMLRMVASICCLLIPNFKERSFSQCSAVSLHLSFVGHMLYSQP